MQIIWKIFYNLDVCWNSRPNVYRNILYQWRLISCMINKNRFTKEGFRKVSNFPNQHNDYVFRYPCTIQVSILGITTCKHTCELHSACVPSILFDTYSSSIYSHHSWKNNPWFFAKDSMAIDWDFDMPLRELPLMTRITITGNYNMDSGYSTHHIPN